MDNDTINVIHMPNCQMIFIPGHNVCGLYRDWALNAVMMTNPLFS